MAKKIKTITIDTSTAIQNNLFMEMSKKTDFDTWHDFGTGLWNMITFLQDKGFEIILLSLSLLLSRNLFFRAITRIRSN